ncbi:unnamed protein product [Prorocentrum cordatum]|uniref:RanBP2-type domain-containing protein n=1 Tax=Prorocentrum cordatum TaxID=2364126 RepID=A0ABN9X174_9DINO|nr:unnamed protein product [Polarella glacialis]
MNFWACPRSKQCGYQFNYAWRTSCRMCGQAPKKPVVADPPPPRGAWQRPPQINGPRYQGPTHPSDDQIEVFAGMAPRDFDAISDGWHPRVVGRVRAARAMLQGEPRECAKQARIQQDVFQQKLEKAKSKYERAQNSLAQAMQATAQAKAEMESAQAAADEAAAKAAKAFSSLAPAQPSEGEAAFHAWAQGIRGSGPPAEGGPDKEKYDKLIKQLEDMAKDLGYGGGAAAAGGLNHAVPLDMELDSLLGDNSFITELESKHGIKHELATNILNEAKERLEKKARSTPPGESNL